MPAGITNCRPYQRQAPSETTGATGWPATEPKHGWPMSQYSPPSVAAASEARMPMKGQVPVLPRIQPEAQ